MIRYYNNSLMLRDKVVGGRIAPVFKLLIFVILLPFKFIILLILLLMLG